MKALKYSNDTLIFLYDYHVIFLNHSSSLLPSHMSYKKTKYINYVSESHSWYQVVSFKKNFGVYIRNVKVGFLYLI